MVLFAGTIVLLTRVRRRGMFIRLRPIEVRQVLARIKTWGRTEWTFGLRLIKCEEHQWQDAVESALESCQAVVIDLSEFNENIAWEIE